MKNPSLSRTAVASRIAWNDIEALPVYAAILLALAFALLALTDLTPSVEGSGIKAAGIFGALALRHAWLRLDAEDGPLG